MYGEDSCKEILSTFICSLNMDVNDLLDLACQNVQNVQHIIGGKTTYIECASNSKLHEFYSTHGFVPFGEREREIDELDDSPTLVQMLRYFKS